MTRFARSRGSKASNERLPNEPTPWHVMKLQVDSTTPKNEKKGKAKTAKNLLKEADAAGPSGSAGKASSSWAQFEVVERKKKGVKKHASNNTKQKVEGANMKSKLKNSTDVQNKSGKANSGVSSETSSNDKSAAATNPTKKKAKNAQNINSDSVDTSSKQKQNLKRKNENSGDNQTNKFTKHDNAATPSGESDGNVSNRQNRGASNRGNPNSFRGRGTNFFRGRGAIPFRGRGAIPFRGRGAMPFRGRGTTPFRGRGASPFRGQGTTPFRGRGTMPFRGRGTTPFRGRGTTPFRGRGTTSFRGRGTTPFRGRGTTSFRGRGTNSFRGRGTNSVNTENDSSNDETPVEDTQFPSDQEIVNQKKPKIRDNKEHARRKPDEGSTKMTINGFEVEIVKYDGFPVRKEDATRLTELKQKMVLKGIPQSDIDAAMKLERRKAEKALARIRRCVCFYCRKAGHNLSDCPDLASEQMGTGICFKCGSTEHTHFECKVAKPTEFRFATCFICRERGHIAKQCPDNPTGVYPQGGSCNVCGDVTHLKKDCPDLAKQKGDTAITVDKIADDALECLEDEVQQSEEEDEKPVKQKVVTF